ncbi:2-hydroxy-3-oxopropionate reductase [Novipirellula aureliae]|uniref:2-hydroxy-3-oxopropionate reductase n=1 Tax=Novipirellula aureliae TaxID=2527966 RepID=A0A5C6DIT0_9BACT|nr:NAD(P)-dependent oxidoreductase [Novipirellula aureliae]TWU35787.1 2-hydroxy-3-oxopropionate reductase [Novipirellula aureliae]
MNIEPNKTRIGWIGTGVMGKSMCGHLLQSGFSVTVYNRTRSKAESLVRSGARWVDSPRQVAEESDVVFTIVSYPEDVRKIYLCKNSGMLAGAKEKAILVDMTTSEPSLAIEIYNKAQQLGVSTLDAPVSGGDSGARNQTLSIMVGGAKETFETVKPCFEQMGKTIVHQGGAGAGQHTKMVNQTLIASGMVGVCEALIYATRAGLDLETVLASVGSGAAGSWSLSNLGPRMIAGDFEPGFYVEHFIKDMGIVLSESRRMGLSMPGLALADQLYQSVKAKGMHKKGTQALVLALAELSAVDWPNTESP